MSRPLPTTLRALRRLHPRPHAHLSSNPTQHHLLLRTLSTTPQTHLNRPLNSLSELSAAHEDAKASQSSATDLRTLKRRRNLAATGIAVSVLATFALLSIAELSPPDKTESSRPFPPTDPAALAAEEEKHRTLRATGTSHVPFFPRTITLPSAAPPQTTATPALPAGVTLPGEVGGAAGNAAEEEFSLLGLGIRTVSFLSIQVYVVGLYVATKDLPLLQRAMIKEGADVAAASTLVAGEKKALKERLLDAQGSTEVWERVLREEGIRSVVRVVPTRGTGYDHLRDGWVRGIMAKTGNATQSVTGERFDDQAFGEAVGAFKKMFGNRKLGKGNVLLLEREKSGTLVGWEEKGQEMEKMGKVEDERVGRLVWMLYLAGKDVSSDGARRDIVDGVLDLVERPLGTIETQVV